MTDHIDTATHTSGERRRAVFSRLPRVAGVLTAGAAAMLFLTGGVPWVDNKAVPSIEGREPLNETQKADEAYVRGRESYDQALEFERKAQSASSDGKRRRYEDRAQARFKASADAFEVGLKRALKQDYTPDYLPDLYLQMANALFRIGRFEESIERYEDALAVAPAYLGARYGLARAQLATGRLEAVRASYDTLLTEADTRAQAWDYVDALMSDVQRWLTHDIPDSVTPGDAAAMKTWHAETAAELADTIRWTALDDVDESP